MTVRNAIAPLAALALALAPAPAFARHHIVAPGDPGSSQYQEDVPTASGSRPVTTLTPPSSTAPSQAVAVVPVEVVHKLSHEGNAGRSALSLAQQAAPPLPRPHTTVRPLSYHAAATVSVLTNSLLGSGGGMGVFLPLILFIGLGAVAVVLVIRRAR